MTLFKNTSIRTKIFMGFAGVILVTTVLFGIVLFSLSSLNGSLKQNVLEDLPAVLAAARLNRNLSELRLAGKALLISETEQEATQYNMALRETQADIRQELDELSRMGLDDRSLALVNAYSEAYLRYTEALLSMQTLFNEGKIPEATALNHGDMKTHAETAFQTSRSFMIAMEASVKKNMREGEKLVHRTFILSFLIWACLAAVALGISRMVSGSISGSFNRLVGVADAIAEGNLDSKIPMEGGAELGSFTRAVSRMQEGLREAREASETENWLKTGMTRLNEAMRGRQSLAELGVSVISEIAEYINAQAGAIYVLDEDGESAVLRLFGSYAFTERKSLSLEFLPGQGLVGQAALEKKMILIQEAPKDYIRVTSGLGNSLPRNICVIPFLHEGVVRGVVEVGALKRITELQRRYLDQIMPAVAAAFIMVQNQTTLRRRQQELMAANEKLNRQTDVLKQSEEELKSQQKELENANEELEAQTRQLKQSEEELKAQTEELEVVNVEMAERNRQLEEQKREVEMARGDLARKAEDLALAGKYKSDFLANMSHELRTPLNSLLLLARGLQENREANLSPEQVESAGIIYESGRDLLNLINDILDLAKIEAGRTDLRLETVLLEDILASVRSQFRHMADEKGLTLTAEAFGDAPERLVTDPRRLGQVLKNLVGNAVKFTDQGGISVRAYRPEGRGDLLTEAMDAEKTIAFEVKDSGIGIPRDKQQIVFEAFQQADAGDQRRFGGTGLGLSISRELAQLLGGRIHLQSQTGKGATFTLLLPIESRGQANAPLEKGQVETPKPQRLKNKTPETDDAVSDDRHEIQEGDRIILIIEDDPRFAGILAGQCRERGFKHLTAPTGEAGLELAKKHLPDGIILDLQLPNMDGWAVLTALKNQMETRHIPVHIASVEEPSTEGMRMGAVGHAGKPLDPGDLDLIFDRLAQSSNGDEKRVLVVEDDPVLRQSTVALISDNLVTVEEAKTGKEAMELLRQKRFNLVVLDLGLPDIPGTELLKTLADEKTDLPPVIIHTIRDLTADEEMTLRNYTDSIILKDVRSQERLLDEVALFLHRVVSDLPAEKMQIIQELRHSDAPLKGKKVLVAEDDMRTMFAMTKLLAAHGIHPLKAENGEKALHVLNEEPDVDLILMDVMMPVMDGYETMKRIRSEKRFRNLPIIALTAKAMKEDRRKCLDAGATDYLPKPVEQDRLISLLRVWLLR